MMAPPSRRALLVGPTLVGALAGVIVVIATWPLWPTNPVSLVFATIMPSLVAAAGWVLVRNDEARLTGICMIGMGFTAALSNTGLRRVSIWPFSAEFLQATYYILAAVIIIYCGRRRITTFLEKLWLWHAAVIIVAIKVAVILTTTPEMASWEPSAFSVAIPELIKYNRFTLWLATWEIVWLGASLAALLLWRHKHLPRDRRQISPAPYLAATVVIVAGALYENYLYAMGPDDVSTLLASRVAQDATALAFPLIIMAVMISEQWRRQTVGGRIMRQLSDLSPGRLEDIVGRELDDDNLTIWTSVPDQGRYVSGRGHIRISQDFAQHATAERDRFRPLYGPDGEELAVIELSAPAPGDSAVLDSLCDTIQPYIVAVSRQQRHMEALRETSRLRLKAENNTYRRLGQDLHDNVQQTLHALQQEIRRLRRMARRPEMKEQSALCAEYCRQAISEVRQVSRGIEPPLLKQSGLRAAIEECVAMIDLPVTVEVPSQRWHREVEVSMYYGVREVLTNIAKHANASHASVVGIATNDLLVITITDDGDGTARVVPGGGLANTINRLESLGGDTTVKSTPGHGTTIELAVPLYATAPLEASA